MELTKLQYLEAMDRTEAEAKMLGVTEENGKTTLFLNQTIFYPQGGGQPYDQGVIESPNGRFHVDEVRWKDGIVHHIGAFESGAFPEGETVQCRVNAERRKRNSKYHSAGHIIDMALKRLKLAWTPVKGHHFPNEAYDEYRGTFEANEKEKLKNDIETMCNTLIQENHPTSLSFVTKEEANQICVYVPDNISEGKPLRVMKFGAEFAMPCGGTHVKSLGEIEKMTIRKLKQDGDHVKVAYEIFSS